MFKKLEEWWRGIFVDKPIPEPDITPHVPSEEQVRVAALFEKARLHAETCENEYRLRLESLPTEKWLAEPFPEIPTDSGTKTKPNYYRVWRNEADRRGMIELEFEGSLEDMDIKELIKLAADSSSESIYSPRVAAVREALVKRMDFERALEYAQTKYK
jgi:hypothetical protein